jgi:hypothetical protein
MQSSKKKMHNQQLNPGQEAVKRTTIILDTQERAYIDALIREGKESGIKPLISKMLDIYQKMMIYDWRFPGEYYCGISRVAFVNIELMSLLIQQVPKEKWRPIGKTMGAVLKVSMEMTLELPSINHDNWERVFKRLSIQGLGDFSLKDKYLLVKTPFINESEILAGLLEGLLDIKLDVKNMAPPLVFEVKTGLRS